MKGKDNCEFCNKRSYIIYGGGHLICPECFKKMYDEYKMKHMTKKQQTIYNIRKRIHK